MDDFTVRLVVVGASVMAVGVASLLMRRRRSGSSRAMADTGMDQGVYLLTSGGCEQCGTARNRMERQVGPDGYTEVAWELDPDLFERLRISEVPSTLIVAADGSGRWHAGVPRSVGDNP